MERSGERSGRILRELEGSGVRDCEFGVRVEYRKNVLGMLGGAREGRIVDVEILNRLEKGVRVSRSQAVKVRREKGKDRLEWKLCEYEQGIEEVVLVKSDLREKSVGLNWFLYSIDSESLLLPSFPYRP